MPAPTRAWIGRCFLLLPCLAWLPFPPSRSPFHFLLAIGSRAGNVSILAFQPRRQVDEHNCHFIKDSHKYVYHDGSSEVEMWIVREDRDQRAEQLSEDKWDCNDDSSGNLLVAPSGLGDLLRYHGSDETYSEGRKRTRQDAGISCCLSHVLSDWWCIACSSSDAQN